MISVYLLLDFAQHVHILKGARPQAALITGRLQPKDKGVHREMESEGSRRQISALMNKNMI